MNSITLNRVASGRDNVLGAEYEIVMANAKQLSAYLKSQLKAIGVDYNKFNSHMDEAGWAFRDDITKATIKNPPAEIYEYQNFFLFQKTDGGYVLLDGFRRLLWYNAPDANIYVRIYQQKDLTDQQILTLMISLNHFKFYGGGGSYHDRGFALLLKTIFLLNIPKYQNAFDAYLSSDEIRNSYSGGYGKAEKNKTVKERILNPMFVADMKFLEQLNDAGCMVNEFTRALLYKERQKTDKEFSAKDFITTANANTVLQELMPKFEKAGTNRSAESQKWVNRIMEIYENIFTLLRGEKVEKSYAEKLKECKDMVAEINKDKQWSKLTGSKYDYNIEQLMEKKIRGGKTSELEFKCIIYPKEASTFDYGNKKLSIDIPYGLNEKIRFIKFEESRNYGSRPEMVLGFKLGKATFSVFHNYGDWRSYGKKYTKLENRHQDNQTVYDIDLFVNIPRADVIAHENARFPNRVPKKV